MKFFLIWLALALTVSVARAEHELNLPANEAGKIMVVMYHVIGKKEGEYARTIENFRKDLELLYQNGYYLVNFVDMIDGRFKVPAGKTPVILTFDDATTGQIVKDSNGKWSSECAVGMINEMYEKHPDFGRAGSFYLNANKAVTPSMLREMVDLGYELGNHTYDHPHLPTLTQSKIAEEIVKLQNWILQAVPGYTIRTMAIPFGQYPKPTEWAAEGEHKGIMFKHEGLLMVGSSPSDSPFLASYNPLKTPRLRGSDGPNAMYLTGAVKYFNEHPSQRFISDGDEKTITIPAKFASQIKPQFASKFKTKLQ